MKKYNVTVNGVVYEVEVEEVTGAAVSAPAAAPVAAPAPAAKPAPAPAAAPAPAPAAPAVAGGTPITAPMPGTVTKILVKAGDAVKKGDVICILEAMKMENEICAPSDATVASVVATAGASVNSGDVLVTLA